MILDTICQFSKFWTTLTKKYKILEKIAKKTGDMSAVGKTPNGLELIRIPSPSPTNIQEGSAEIICEDIDILSNPRVIFIMNVRNFCAFAFSTQPFLFHI